MSLLFFVYTRNHGHSKLTGHDCAVYRDEDLGGKIGENETHLYKFTSSGGRRIHPDLVSRTYPHPEPLAAP